MIAVFPINKYTSLRLGKTGLNHRLELAVNDCVNDITLIKNFKAFLDSLCSLYSNNSKIIMS